MKKNILLITLGLIIGFLIYTNLSLEEKVSELELEVSNNENKTKIIEEKLSQKENEFEAMKKLVALWTARAYGSGYEHSN